MMLRVESTKNDQQTTIQISGRLEGKHLQDLEARREATGSPVTFDLSELRSADEQAIKCLSDWTSRGVRVIGASPYISLLLERAQEETDR